MSSVFDSLGNSTKHLFSASTSQQSSGEQLNFKNKTANKVVGAILNSECIPCGGRVNLLVEMEWQNPLINLKKQWKAYIDQLRDMLKNILQLFDWDDEGKFVDLCTVVKFFDDFVCIPDLLRIGSILMALMGKLSFDFNFGMMSIILNLAGLLLKPFLDSVIDAFMKYMSLIVDPIKCILNSIQTLLRKLDFQTFLQNIGSVEIGLKGFPGTKGVGSSGQNISFNYPVIDINKPLGFGAGNSFSGGGSFDTGISGSSTKFSINKITKMKAQSEVNAATQNLSNVNKSAQSIDGTNATDVARFKTQQTAAEQRYKAANQKLNDANYMKNAGEQINKMSKTINSLMAILEGCMRKAIEMFYTLFDEVVAELRKLEGEFVGLAGSFSGILMQKLQIIQLIELVNVLYDAFIKGEKCVDENGDVNFDRVLNTKQQAVSVVRNSDGSYEIRNPGDLDEALDNLTNQDPNTNTEPHQTSESPPNNPGGGNPSDSILNRGNFPVGPDGRLILSPAGGDPSRARPTSPNIRSGTGNSILPDLPNSIDPLTGLPDPIDRTRPLTPKDKDPSSKVFSPGVPVNDPYYPIAEMLDGLIPSIAPPQGNITNGGLVNLGTSGGSALGEGVGFGAIPNNKPFTSLAGNPFAPTYGQPSTNTLGPLAKDPTAMPQIASRNIPGGSYDNTKAAQSRKKLKSLLQSTGDPVLDADLARIAEAVTTPKRVVIKCQLANSVADAERVNKWIEELNK